MDAKSIVVHSSEAEAAIAKEVKAGWKYVRRGFAPTVDGVAPPTAQHVEIFFEKEEKKPK